MKHIDIIALLFAHYFIHFIKMVSFALICVCSFRPDYGTIYVITSHAIYIYLPLNTNTLISNTYTLR